MIIQLEQAAASYNELKKALSELHDALRVDMLLQEKVDLDAQLQNPDVYSDLKKTNELSKKLKSVCNKLDSFSSLSSRVDDVGVMIDLCREEENEAEAIDLLEETKSLAEDIENLKLVTLLSGKYDEQNAILSLHAGAGGTEAQDWCEMLYRMYTRYAEKMGFSVKEVDYLAGDDAGIKSVTFMVMGENAYGYLKAEMGVHRLVRISPFDANARRHTSFASLEVMPEVTDTEEIEIKPEDLKIDTFRSSGAGGQHVNRTESAIRITHLPTGIVVSCQNERSQVQNKELAMRMLFSKLTEKREQEILAKEAALKGDVKKIEWGSQIRSYVFCPYTLVKDHRTGFENTNVQAVMDGDIQPFILDYLRKTQK